MKTLMLIFLLFYSTESFAQPKMYKDLVKKADSFYEKNDFQNAIIYYQRAFEILGWKGFQDDRYKAACCWAQLHNADSAFLNLDRILSKTQFSDFERLKNDTLLVFLHQDKRWDVVLNIVSVRRKKFDDPENVILKEQIDSMVTEDQNSRGLMRKYGNGELDKAKYDKTKLERNIILIDSLNYFQLKKIFGKYKFPGYDRIGEVGSNNFWLLVQHQDKHPSFQDSVLLEMKIQVDSSNASSSNYAYLVDRVKVNTNQLQVYGTQMQMNSDSTSYEPRPVVDPGKLNERRKSMGLTTIEDYMESMNNFYYGTLKK